MSQTEFVYVTYIRTTPEKLWRALTESVFIRRYFEGGSGVELAGRRRRPLEDGSRRRTA